MVELLERILKKTEDAGNIIFPSVLGVILQLIYLWKSKTSDGRLMVLVGVHGIILGYAVGIFMSSYSYPVVFGALMATGAFGGFAFMFVDKHKEKIFKRFLKDKLDTNIDQTTKPNDNNNS